jgi:hypothetical protein
VPRRAGLPSKARHQFRQEVLVYYFIVGRVGALRSCESTCTHTDFMKNQCLAAAKIYHALVIKSMDAERRLHYRYEV